MDLTAHESGTLISNTTYTFTVSNNGPQSMDSGTFTLTYPAGTVPVQPPQGDLSCTLVAATRTATCTLPASLASGASVHETLAPRVHLLTVNLGLTATATRVAGTPTDPNSANNTDTAVCLAITPFLVHCP